MDDDNLHADTFCCRRIICDCGLLWWHTCHRHKQQGITLVMQLSMEQILYQIDLEQKKKDVMKDTVTRKRKAVDDASH